MGDKVLGVRCWVLGALIVSIVPLLGTTAAGKEAGVFYPASLIEKARVNVAKDPWAAEQRKLIAQAAEPWAGMSDDELWGLMFGPTIHRSWMVWSDGFCPSCKKGVPMYNWVADALNQPWKFRCPECKELFPKNDFGKFYRSGLDAHGIFDPKLADRSLLFNTEHPDLRDTLHMFGVDDGTGYLQDGKKWQFISAYLVYGQWKQAVLGGIRNLSTAYIVTGDRKYAHKAAILLDRVADLYPSFDYMTQADLYDDRNHAHGYVSVWHDACEETRELAMEYDMVFNGMGDDKRLVEFLSAKAKHHGIENPKSSIGDIRRNIEDRILRDALNNIPKISSNYPRTQITMIVMTAVLGWPEKREDAYAILDPMLEQATAVDGVTGEKGLVDYSAHTIKGVANMLAQFARLDPEFMRDTIKRHPRVYDMFRFFIDTWCIGKYYPHIGDAGWFAGKHDQYVGVEFSRGYEPMPYMYAFSLSPSMFTFLGQLYDVTGDASFVQALHHANGDSIDGLPYDLFCGDTAEFRKAVKDVIAREGPMPRLASVNKQQWHLAILRSGEGDDARALWLQYDAWGGHGHANCMELGLYARGLDLMPDFGYRPVQYGGWDAPKSVWYAKTAAHDTVVVDGNDQGNGAAVTTLWADGEVFHTIRASGPTAMGGLQFERTAALIDITDRDAYALDVFRVIGGSDHAKFMGSHFGTITTQGLDLKPAADYGYGTQMRNFLGDQSAKPGWSVDWKVEDRRKYLQPGADVHLRYTDLTRDAAAFTAEAWISAGGYYDSNEEAWIPRIMVRRTGKDAPLASTFVAVMEPYEKKSSVKAIQTLGLENAAGEAYLDNNAAVEVRLAGNQRDLLVSMDAENPLGRKPSAGIVVQKDWGLRTDAELCFVRRNAYGKVSRIVICKGSFLEIGDTSIKLKGKTDFIEISIERGQMKVVSGNPEDIESTG